MANANSEYGSAPGVMNAAAVRHTTIACLLYFDRNCGVMIPSAVSARMAIGTSNTTPNATHMLIAKSKYSVAEIIGVSAVDSMLIRN